MRVHRCVARPTDDYDAMVAIYCECEHGPQAVWTCGKTMPHTFPAPNQALQATANNVRSSLAPALRHA
jgi:hypothetical protein